MPDLSEIVALVETQKTILLAKGHLEDVINQKRLVQSDLNRLAHLLNEKYETVEKLESKSLGNVFRSILGNQESQLEMERQEYLQVVLQYHEAKKMTELLDFELSVLKKQINQETVIELKLEKAIQLHRAQILQEYPSIADRVIQLEKTISRIAGNKKEITEALLVAQELKNILDSIITNLDRASNWGDWEDMQLSRKLEVKSKNLFVDRALAQVYSAQLRLRKFEKELKDIHDHKNITGSYHFHDFGNFTEVYYNRLIADWVIQKRIKNSKLNVQAVNDSINMIAASLAYELKETDTKIATLKQEIGDVIKASLQVN